VLLIGHSIYDMTVFVGVAVWLQSLTPNYFAPHRCGFGSHQELRILSSEEAIQLVYGMWVVLLSCLFIPEIIHRGAS
jgi:hypothetical protein